jgi:hypothetical protein
MKPLFSQVRKGLETLSLALFTVLLFLVGTVNITEKKGQELLASAAAKPKTRVVVVKQKCPKVKAKIIKRKKLPKKKNYTRAETKAIVTAICLKRKVPLGVCLNVSRCESGGWNQHARNDNGMQPVNGKLCHSIDKGVFQINRCWHPKVTEAQADDPYFATEFFAQKYHAGAAHLWSCYRKLYN